jgi:hypothetical protein
MRFLSVKSTNREKPLRKNVFPIGKFSKSELFTKLACFCSLNSFNAKVMSITFRLLSISVKFRAQNQLFQLIIHELNKNDFTLQQDFFNWRNPGVLQTAACTSVKSRALLNLKKYVTSSPSYQSENQAPNSVD